MISIFSSRSFSSAVVALSLLLTPFLDAAEAAKNKEPAVVGSRALSSAVRSQRFFLQEEKEQPQISQGGSRGILSLTDAKRKLSSQEFRACYETFPIDYAACALELHTITGLGGAGEMVSIEDGATFAVASSDRWRVAHWVPGDIVYITPNHGYFFGVFPSSYDFSLYNPHTQESIEVNLSLGPYYFDPVSHWIIGVDHYNGIIALQDGTTFLVDPSDRCYLGEWIPNDHIIVGTNDGCHRGTFPHLLINVATVTYLRGTFVY